ncbi:MAG: hypothetical protein LUC50_08630 [Ruminococcus sp.]|nr:hypothetical protein [Ruminococcus sp.]
MFCKKCGCAMNDSSCFYPKCGTKNTIVRKPPINPTSKRGKFLILANNRNTILAIAVVVVAVVLIITLFCAALGSKGKSKIEGYFKACEEEDAKYFVNHVPDDLLDDLMDSYSATKSEIIDSMEDYMDVMLYQRDWEDYTFENDGRKLSDNKLDDFKDDFEDDLENADVDLNEFDVDDITAAVKWKAEVDGSEGVYYTFKYKGKWYCDIMSWQLSRAAYFYA